MIPGDPILDDGIKDDVLTISCRTCGHLYDGNTGKMILGMENIVIKPEDRGSDNCYPCHLLQKAPDPMRAFWPSR